MLLCGTSGRVHGVVEDGAHVSGEVIGWKLGTGSDSVTEKPRRSGWDAVLRIQWPSGVYERLCELPHVQLHVELHRPDGTEVIGEGTVVTCEPILDEDYGTLLRTDLHGLGPLTLRKAEKAFGRLAPVEFED
ncbi:MAG: hypothetical protein KatS3mg115_2122 [Candidatus Poribacteria bacterium]|nr:MAG: hypothetical protein KatS3mg115_2122 [Candidatus Poribacteria bacterium]